ncbi:CPBP family intramembrane glutamic endopeptidase [Pontibacter arcticus]|uniref:CPBP family intramembrane metalloprotease n=1 Tax=Pontibacter arcticus TaxID=2080288 RepID=A0A364RJC3_9BACT|nr:type II CAAX endopeptidase family protein [Pontibacter arcticus]RAU84338.1 CPBP family intramembrane metalloprotease [Pontibacter arcticus]
MATQQQSIKSDVLKPVWQKAFKFNWQLGCILIFLIGIPRFILVLQANVTGNYNLVPLVFLLMGLTPFLFLTKAGRQQIGMKKPEKYSWLVFSFLIGAAVCAVAFFVTEFLFSDTISNSFVYISKSYAVSRTGFSDADRLIYFIIYAVIGMSFSPIGEELFYRGVVHGSLAVNTSEYKASVLDSLAFAITHLAHFGIIYTLGKWEFLFLPALVWVFFMFVTSRIFFVCKQQTGSVWGAVASHAGFNLAMMYFIFYRIL